MVCQKNSANKKSIRKVIKINLNEKNNSLRYRHYYFVVQLGLKFVNVYSLFSPQIQRPLIFFWDCELETEQDAFNYISHIKVTQFWKVLLDYVASVDTTSERTLLPELRPEIRPPDSIYFFDPWPNLPLQLLTDYVKHLKKISTYKSNSSKLQDTV